MKRINHPSNWGKALAEYGYGGQGSVRGSMSGAWPYKL